jgi:hypothetical protein
MCSTAMTLAHCACGRTTPVLKLTRLYVQAALWSPYLVGGNCACGSTITVLLESLTEDEREALSREKLAPAGVTF